VALDAIFYTPDAKGDLSMALSLTTKTMNFWGEWLESMGKEDMSETRKIRSFSTR